MAESPLHMSMSAGTRVGTYEILELLGVGGMGEVYRARDTKLDRHVAIKVLPAAFAQDPERVARFAREAKTLAALNHSNIGGIHGLEEASGITALVLELVEGPTLADRIARGPIPLDEALPMARQIADALEAAHEQGIIHRDLKPANIKVRDDGTVKVLDFGLAKAISQDLKTSGPQDLPNSPTITSPALMTGVGVLLGTAAYMSPEQAKGRQADKRSDIWAFGCVLFEMLTSQRAFPGDDLSETLAAVIKSEPNWAALPATTPASVRTLLRRCLEKDRRRRLADVADARLELDDASNLQRETDDTRSLEAATTPVRFRRERMAWAGGVMLLGLIAAVSLVVGFRSPPRPPELRADIVLPPGTVSPVISPDGRRIAFVARADGVWSVWVHSLDGRRSRPLDRTDVGDFRNRVFWAPDSRSIGFFADGKLKRVDVESGAVQTLADAPQNLRAGGAWSRNGAIVFAPTTGPLFRVSQAGDGLAAVTRVEGPQIRHTQPQFLPDGRHFLFFSSGDPSRQGVYVADLEGATAARRLLADVDGAVYATSGHMFFSRQGALLAQRFDADRLTLVGDPWQVAERVGVDLRGALSFSASDAGPIVYDSGDDDRTERRLIWFDRSGRELQRLDDRDPVNGSSFSLSRDGDRLAVGSTGGGTWLIDARREGRRTRLASPDAHFTIWSPEGGLVFQSSRSGVGNLYQRTLTGNTDELFLETPGSKAPNDWSPDGRLLLYRDNDATTGFDLLVVPVERDGKSGRLMPAAAQQARPVATTTAGEMNGQFSPDGVWIAYESDESGQWEIYLQPFERAGERVQISLDGGRFARWRRDGSELYFYAPDGWLMAATIRPSSNGRIGTADPVRLFRVPLEPSGGQQPQFLVSPDGQRFLANVITETSPVVVTMIVNWSSTR